MLLTGKKVSGGILCDCCNIVYMPGKFECHAGFPQVLEIYLSLETNCTKCATMLRLGEVTFFAHIQHVGNTVTSKYIAMNKGHAFRKKANWHFHAASGCRR